MKKILFIIILSILPFNVFSQVYKRIDKTQIVKRECDLIVVTTDSLVAHSMRNIPQMVEEVSCYSSYHKSIALMFWFKIDADKIVQDNLNNFVVEVQVQIE